MSFDVGPYAQIAGIIASLFTTMVVVTLGAVIALRRLKRPIEQYTAVTDDRIQRLQDSIDTIAVEVERISEAQRFMVKLQAGDEAKSADAPLLNGRSG